MDKADIEKLKANYPILEVLHDLGIPVLNNRIRCLRPENHSHGDKNPSVTIWPERGSFKCWVCPDVKGDSIDLVRLARGFTFPEALAFLKRKHPDTHHPITIYNETDLTEPILPLVFPHPVRHDSASVTASPAPVPVESQDELQRHRILKALLAACTPLSGRVGQYLVKRRIFKRTWDRQGLRMIGNYSEVSRKLEADFSLADLERTGFFNAAGHLRYYRHPLLFPYYNQSGQPVYMQARAIDADVRPKELSMSGHIPLPYNCRVLDGVPGQIYLCEGIIDTLTLIEQGFPAVGVPGAAIFKPHWADLFANKTVHVAYDPDAPGESGALKAMEILKAHGVDVRRLAPPKGMDLNEWFQKG